MSQTLPLSPTVVSVTVSIAPVAAAAPTFNQGLILGTSTVIPSTSGSNPRLREYTSTAAALADGWTNQPEFIALGIYFSQTPAPQIGWIGRQDLTLGTPETPLVALEACRAASGAWWACMSCTAVTADHEAIAAWVQSTSPASFYFCSSPDAALVAGTTGNVALTLQALNYSRVFGTYNTTQSGAFPNNIYEAAAAMGEAMGLNTGLANSNFTMKYKQLAGIAAEPLTPTQVANIESAGFNTYVGFVNTYSWLQQGIVPNGQYFDTILNIDMIASDFQYSLANGFISVPSVPHDNPGQAQLLVIAQAVCERAVTRGFIAPGTWGGQQILNLSPGDPMPNGYRCQSQDFSVQSPSDKAARKGMPIYVSLLQAGSMHSVTIAISAA
jgi:hypothetical protein